MKKIQNDPEAQYMYRCRMCGKEYVSGCSGTDWGFKNLINAIHKITIDNQTPLSMVSAHQCTKIKGGIADLIGYFVG